MRVLLQGAFNDNFGDNLFTKMFYDAVRKVIPEESIYFNEDKFFGISDRLADEIGYKKKGCCRKADVLVYYSGGYFGEKTGSLYEAIGRYLIYCRIAKRFRKKAILIIAVGAGPISNRILRKCVVNIFNHAQLSIVRDEQSAAYMKEYGVTNEILISTDTAQQIENREMESLPVEISTCNKKKLYFHLSQLNNKEIILIADAIKLFVQTNPYLVCFGYDGFSYNREDRMQTVDLITNIIGKDNCFYYEYESVDKFSSFINEMDLVITPKLHVGIVSCVFGKSVISFPHHQKIYRYYSQIGYADRCYDLSELQCVDIVAVLERYKNERIVVPPEFKQKAIDNINMLQRYLVDYKRKNKKDDC